MSDRVSKFPAQKRQIIKNKCQRSQRQRNQMDNQKHKSFPDKEQLKATYEKRVKSWSELFAKVHI